LELLRSALGEVERLEPGTELIRGEALAERPDGERAGVDQKQGQQEVAANQDEATIAEPSLDGSQGVFATPRGEACAARLRLPYTHQSPDCAHGISPPLRQPGDP